MKHKLLYLPLSCLLISVSSCASIQDEKKSVLSLASNSKESYVQFEVFDYSTLHVVGLTYLNDSLIETTDIDDFEVYDKDTLIKDGSRLSISTFDTPYSLTLKKDGYQSVDFSITVTKAANFVETMSVTAPTKEKYSIGDTLDLSGLTVQVTTKYSVNGQFTTKTETLSDTEYRVVAEDGKEAKNLSIDSYGIHRYMVQFDSFSTIGKPKVLESSFSVYVIDERIQSTPVDYSSTTKDDFEEDNRTVTISIDSQKTANGKGYLEPSEINDLDGFYAYGQNNAQNWQYSPSTGDVPFLVIPLVIPGYDSLATSELLDTINKAFFASSSEIPFESLRSYYAKASGGKLNITGTVTDYFIPEKMSKDFNEKMDFMDPSRILTPLLNEALAWAKDTYSLDLTSYDVDHNGILDGIWFVYVYDEMDTEIINFWAYSSTTGQKGTKENPVINNFGWVGCKFLTDSPGLDSGLDAHVIIHESGHMFGLSDYYSYNQTGTDRYSPLGRADMMDNNCSDQNPFSKLMVGWQKPYVVYSSCEITLKTSQLLDQVILIPYDSLDYSDESYTNSGKQDVNLFDEYLLVDFYTDKNLNSRGYEKYYVNSIEGYGVRIYHVDNRLSKVTVRTNQDTYQSTLLDGEESKAALKDGKNDVIKAISNTESGERSEATRFGLPLASNNFDEIRLIYADKTYASYQNEASIDSLFAPNGNLNKNASFSLNDYASQFYEGAFDNKESFSYTIEIKSMND